MTKALSPIDVINIQMFNDYWIAFDNVKKKQEELTKDAALTEEKKLQAWDTLFVLHYMQQSVSKIHQLSKLLQKDRRAIIALTTILSQVEKNPKQDLYSYIENVKVALKSEQSLQALNDLRVFYNKKAGLKITGAILTIALGACLTFFLVTACLATPPGLLCFLLALEVAFATNIGWIGATLFAKSASKDLNDSRNIKASIKAQIIEMTSIGETILHVPADHVNETLGTRTVGGSTSKVFPGESGVNIRSRFFNGIPQNPMKATSVEVQEAYNALMPP